MARGRLSDEEWALFAPFVIERGPKRGRPPADHRRVLDAVFWMARTGSPWRDLPPELGRWDSVYQQFSRWTCSGLWDVLLEALAESRAVADTVQMDTSKNLAISAWMCLPRLGRRGGARCDRRGSSTSMSA